MTCTYQSNCDLSTMWTKDRTNSLHPVPKERRLGNNTKSLTYTIKNAEKKMTKKIIKCFISDREFVNVELEVKGKDQNVCPTPFKPLMN